MKSNVIVLSFLLIAEGVFASDVNKSVCPCGPIEHLLGKGIVRKYVQEHPDSGVVANFDNEGVPENIVEAVTKFGQTINLMDVHGNSIMPREFKNTGNMVLPMYLCSEFVEKGKALKSFDTNNRTDATILLKQFLNQYKFNKLCADNVCGECAVQNKNGRK